MKTKRKVLLVLIFGVGLPLAYFSAYLQQVNVVGKNREAIGATTTTTSATLVNQQFRVTNREDIITTDDNNNNTMHFDYVNLPPFRKPTPTADDNENHPPKQGVTTATTNLHINPRLKPSSSSELLVADRFAMTTTSKQVLEFVHITKTGGSAVEIAGGHGGLKWGVCHFRHQPEYGPGCRKGRPDWLRPRNRLHEIALRNNTPMPHFQGEKWHTPPSWFLHNPYQGSTTFTVVRNPYSRVVSEFYCAYFGYYRTQIKTRSRSRIQRQVGPQLPRYSATYKAWAKDNNNETTATDNGDNSSKQTHEELMIPPPQNSSRRRLEEVVGNETSSGDGKNQAGPSDDEFQHERSRHIKNQQENTTNSAASNKGPGVKIVTNRRTRAPLPPPTVHTFNRWIRLAVKRINPTTGHMLPQSYYVFDELNGTRIQVVDHVLKYEKLHKEFSDLMKQYGLDKQVHLSPMKSTPLDPMGRVRFDVSDLDSRTICIINQRYWDDFERFGYPMIQRCSKFDRLEDNDDFIPTTTSTTASKSGSTAMTTSSSSSSARQHDSNSKLPAKTRDRV